MQSITETTVQRHSLRKWLWDRRSTTRLAFVMQMGKRIANALCGLIWARLLVGAMGLEFNDLFLTLKNVFSFGGLGDLGMGGAVALRVGKYLGGEKSNAGEHQIKHFLSCARAMFLLIAGLTIIAATILSPSVLGSLGFSASPQAGSLVMMGVMGGFMMAQVMLMSYGANLNYACGNVVWPVLPSFLLLQLAFLGHWLLARMQSPLWLQLLPYVFCTYVELFLSNYYVRLTHPRLANIFPLSIDRKGTIALLGSSFWIYLCTLGNQLYQSTDGMVIKAGTARKLFPIGTVTNYNFNYKFCELAVFVALTASFVSLPKITQWLHSPDSADQDRVRAEMTRLNQFQTLLGCGAALAYLAGNDLFMKIWWGHASTKVFPAEFMVQLGFALNMAVTASGDTSLQLSLRSGEKGIRLVGIVVAVTGLLNFGLSILAMKYGVLWGIAMATVVAQTVLMTFSSHYICKTMKLNWVHWLMRGCMVPLFAIALAGWLRYIFPPDNLTHAAILVSSYLALFIAGAWALGIHLDLIKSEYQTLRRSIGK